MGTEAEEIKIEGLEKLTFGDDRSLVSDESGKRVHAIPDGNAVNIVCCDTNLREEFERGILKELRGNHVANAYTVGDPLDLESHSGHTYSAYPVQFYQTAE